MMNEEGRKTVTLKVLREDWRTLKTLSMQIETPIQEICAPALHALAEKIRAGKKVPWLAVRSDAEAKK